jgi:replicative DNA helicase
MSDQPPEYDEPTTVTMPPASIQAEEALLGSFLINGSLFKEIAINPGDFYIARNRWIYEAIAETSRSGKQVDFMTICQTLEDNGNLPKVGGAAYLMGLINCSPTSFHAETYAEIIKDRAQRRRMIDIANDLAQSAFDLTRDVEKTVAQSATDLANSARPKGGAQHVSIFASRHFDRIDALSKGDRKVHRIPTGFYDFDRCLNGGLRIPEMLLLMGKPGLGKTKFILQLGFNMGQHEPGAIYEMETDEDQIMDREISRRSEILDTHLETGQLEEREWPLYVQAIDALSNQQSTQVYLDFGSGWTTSTLRSDLARLKAEHNIKWYMVDYMKFLRDPFGKDETERLNYISGRLKQINRELELASVIIHSMNKTGVDAIMPSLSNMSGGADIGFDTDKALFMARHTPDEGQPTFENYRTFFFQKSRSRIADSIFHLQAKKEFPAFLDATKPGQKEPEERKRPGVDY